MRRIALPTVLATLALAGCGGGGESAPETIATATQPPAKTYPGQPAAGQALTRFVDAAARGDTDALFSMLTRRAQQVYGPTAKAFAKEFGKELTEGVGAFRREGAFEVALSVQATPDWAVAVIAGHITHEGTTAFGAYGLPARKEGGVWKLELGGSVGFNPISPDEQLTTDSTPQIATELDANEPILESAMWVDRTSIEPIVSPDSLLMNGEVTVPIPPGRHTAVTFAATESSAGVNAFSFTSR